MVFTFKYSLVVLGLLYCTILQAQSINPDELIGEWGVDDVQLFNNNIPENKQTIVDSMRIAFLRSHISFGSNHSFDFDIELKDARIDSGHWKYDMGSNAILIQRWADKDSDENILLELLPTKQDGKLYFMVAESPFILEMKKEDDY